MKTPITLLENLDKSIYEKWQNQFVANGRNSIDGVWRRTQEKSNAKESGWKNSGDARKKLIQFKDNYDFIKNDNGSYNLVLKSAYLWHFTSLPADEAGPYFNRLIQTANKLGWDIEQKNQTYHLKFENICITVKLNPDLPNNLRELSFSETNYTSIECKVLVGEFNESDVNKTSPWNLYNIGIRKKDKSGSSPKVIEDVASIFNLMPFQLELGAGASINCGIAPLHTLHSIYYVSDPLKKTFYFGEEDKLILDVIKNPKEFYYNSSLLIRQSVVAEPSKLYQLLSKWQDEGKIVGKTITNNFDGLASLVGLSELYIRKFSEKEIFPNIHFDPKAKSLLVIGVHADRRNVQKSARKAGLNVVYLDPQGFFMEDGKWVDYPLESIQNEDYLIPKTSKEFVELLDELES